MQPHEIFLKMKPETAGRIFGDLYLNEKAFYKATIDSLAKQRNLRAVFIERKPRPERFEWMRQALGRKLNESVAAHLLQIWLVRINGPMLCDFLDGLGISHDENGTVDELPAAPAKEDLQKVVETLLSKYPADSVAVYLNAFVAFGDDGGWPSLIELIESDSRIAL